MYFPFLRSRQEEILTLLQLNEVISANNNVIPIIEPVTLIPQLPKLIATGLKFILIVNPSVGDYSKNALPIQGILNSLANYNNLIIGYILKEGTNREVMNVSNLYRNRQIAFFHFQQFNNPQLNQTINNLPNSVYNVFWVTKLSQQYVSGFSGTSKISLVDYFQKEVRNSDYSNVPQFYSDAHLSYLLNGFQGFSDFLTVGAAHTGGGGLPHAVAIHLTYNNPSNGNSIFVNHYVSNSTGGTANVQGKFLQANQLLTTDLNVSLTHIRTLGTEAFIDLQNRSHYPGLGQVKRFSMMNHIELISSLLP